MLKNLKLIVPHWIATMSVLVLLCTMAGTANADIYRYLGENGDIILTTSPRSDLKLIDVIKDQPSQIKSLSPGSASPKTPTNSIQSKETAFDDIIDEASKLYGIPVAFIKAVIKIESNFNPTAVSSAGAMGLMQLMPGTATHMGVTDPFDPKQNIFGGTKYLRRLSDRYDGDINLVLSGYHAGPGNVEKAGGIPFEKTQSYVRNVYGWYLKYQSK